MAKGKAKGRASHGYVAAPPGHQARAAKGRKSGSSGIQTGITIVMLIVVGVYLFAFGGLEELQNLFAPEEDDNTILNVSDRNFDEVLGRDGDFVQVGFLQNVDDQAAVTGILNAAARWSDIVAGTNYPGFSRAAGEPFCNGVDEGFVTAITLTSLVIVISFESLQPNVLGSAGACFISGGAGNVRPLTGQMRLSIEETPGLIASNSFESVVLHEMGHVLGIGPLWDNNNFLVNPVFGSTINLNLQPEYTGTDGLAAYRDLINDQAEPFIPVEDGVFEGIERFDRANGEGGGSIDGHWDKDFFEGELMEFQIAPGNIPPMSTVTIASLGDAGYTVNITLADSYTPPTQSFFKRMGGMLRGSKDLITMTNDIDLSAMQVINT